MACSGTALPVTYCCIAEYTHLHTHHYTNLKSQPELKKKTFFQVHVRVASPPLLYPCYMGINIPTREELIANKMDSVGLAKHVGK
jgi:hypothetical protein